jgi:hypothetical protein
MPTQTSITAVMTVAAAALARRGVNPLSLIWKTTVILPVY